MKKIHIFIFILLLFSSFIYESSAWAKKKNATEEKNSPNQVMVGQVPVTLKAPKGLVRVDGLDKSVDNYIRDVEKKFKLNVLAIYADKDEWLKFTAASKARQPGYMQSLTMICVPAKMPIKSYNDQGAKKEFQKFGSWFSLAANNRSMAALLTSKGNNKLKERMGADIRFKFRTNKETKKLASTDDMVSFGAKVSFNVFGQPFDGYLTATSFRVSDKLIFLAYYENLYYGVTIEDVQAKTKTWANEALALNKAK